jgi:hypothetical protein
MRNTSTAKGNRASSTNRRRTKTTQQVNLNNTVALDSVATQQENSMNTDKAGQVMAMSVPIKLSENTNLETLQTSSPTPLPGNRPIDSSNLQVLGTISVMGERPIAASNNKIWNTMTASGERPIYSSTLVVSETRMIMGNRPIASNYFDGEESLMGYLD